MLDHMRKGPGSAKSSLSRCTAPSDCAGESVPSGEGAVMVPLAIVRLRKKTLGLVPLWMTSR